MPRLGTTDTTTVADVLTNTDPDVIYLGHNYGRDDWHGPGTPYRTLGAAIRAESDPFDDWIDSVELPAGRDGTRGTEWWPTTYDDEPFTPGIDDDHPYIQIAHIKD